MGYQKCPCAFAEYRNCPQLRDIIIAHETRHLNDVTCWGCHLYRPDYDDPKKVSEECDHAREDIKALFKALTDPTLGESCKTLLINAISEENKYIRKECGEK
jgi:hypothetical protein